MILQITQICFNEPDCYRTLSHEHNDRKRHQNDEKTAAIMVLSYYYVASVKKVLLQVHPDRCCSLVKLLCIYCCYFDLLNHG